VSFIAKVQSDGLM